MKSPYWMLRRAERRMAHRLIEWLIERYHWHNNVLDTDVPNVRCLQTKTLTVVNAYGQVHTIR